jgi:hypothetical protein
VHAAFEDWPKDWTKERPFLKNLLQWENPVLLGGVTSARTPKPDFMLYFDGNDTTSPVNSVGETIKSMLSGFELDKVAESGNTNRGACVLVYSPMKTTTFSSFGGGGIFPPEGTQLASGNAGRLFSLQQLRNVLEFHETREARLQCQAHASPMHRTMFGDMM